ncbi:pectate lyase [Haloferula sp. BvORR071]|uniref:pectate lyase n=1 Tax=Haloferula sp. BvORR071 TaxID=1396141 RepID=UPI0009DE9208|nr:pectate lyase [Haloferula sp. BvORR071]
MKRILPALLVLSICHAEPVTMEAIGHLPAGEQAVWKIYLERSQATAAGDQAALQAELAANKMPIALKAPSGGDFRMPKGGEDWFASDEAKALVGVVLSYQAPSGGWSKHTGYSEGPRKPGMLWSSQYEAGKSPHYLATFDNGSTTTQIALLAKVWRATKRADCAAAASKGLNYILAAQNPNGGWPQVYPLEGGYHDDITLNDDAMTHILELLQVIVSKDPAYAFLDESLRDKAAAALEKGLGCVSKMQVVQEGKKAVWCAQHDALTLKAAPARKMEPATLSGSESANLVKFLMTLSQPSPELIATIEGGLAWLERVKITGMTRTEKDGKTAYEPDPSSTEVYWARFYSLADNKPVFPGRDGVVYASFAEMAEKNNLGYDYYTTRPASIVENGQKKWRKDLETP